MGIKIGDKIPDAILMTMGLEGPKSISSADLFSGKKAVVFALPGAFTPTCSAAHLPGFIKNADSIKAKGIDDIICISVNDVFVMHAWGREHNVEDKIKMMADGNCDFTHAAGLELDGRGFGMGRRSKRYSMLVNNGIVEKLFVEEDGEFEVSGAEYMLDNL